MIFYIIYSNLYISDVEKTIFKKNFEIFKSVCKKLRAMLTPYEFNERVDESMFLQRLLPSENQILYILIKYLVNLQNRLIDHSKRINKFGYKQNLESNIWKRISSNEVINIDFERNVEPLIMSICSSRDTKGSINHNFDLLEHQIIFEWIVGRYVLKIDNAPKVHCNDDLVFIKRLKDLNICQEKISLGLEEEIKKECTLLDQVYSCLRNLETVIGYLRNISVNPKDKIYSILHSLGLDTEFFPEVARINCSLKHLKSLWQILMREKSKLVIDGDLYLFVDEFTLSKETIAKIGMNLENRPNMQEFFINNLHDCYCEYLNDMDPEFP